MAHAKKQTTTKAASPKQAGPTHPFNSTAFGDIFGDLFGGAFSKADQPQFAKQSTKAPEHECCGNCSGDGFLDAVIEHKAIFNRLGVLITLASELSGHIRPDVPRILVLLNECQNLVNDGNSTIDGTGLQF